MGTKTITIMDDAYELLAKNKLRGESFTQEIRRVFASSVRKRKLVELFGILSEEEGKGMQDDLEKQREINIRFAKERMKEWNS